MNTQEFDAELNRIRPIAPKETGSLGDLVDFKMKTLPENAIGSRWDAVFDVVTSRIGDGLRPNPRSGRSNESVLLGSLARQLGSLKPEDILTRLERVESRGVKFDNSSYFDHAGPFGGLTHAISALPRPVRLEHFQRYYAQMEARLLTNQGEIDVGSLACAIQSLAQAIPHLDQAVRTRYYDSLSELIDSHLINHLSEDLDVANLGLAKVVGQLPLKDIPSRITALYARLEGLDAGGKRALHRILYGYNAPLIDRGIQPNPGFKTGRGV